MKRKNPIRRWRASRRRVRGFSLIEMLIATVILLVGLVGIAQLVPASILINQKGRLDSTSLVFAQRELDQMLSQKLTAPTFLEANGAFCATACRLGDPTQPGIAVGSPLIFIYNRPLIDFSQPPVPDYSFNYADQNDPFYITYDVRWAVVTTVSASNAAVSKRFIVGVRQLGGSDFVPAVTLDATVGK